MDRFVVGSGRCGSTLLSLMLGRHPRVLNLSEFFNGLDMDGRFATDPVSGKAFAELIGVEQGVVTAVVRRGYEVSEVVYPFDDPGTRYQRDDRLPWLLVTLLPRVTDRPDELYDELLAAASSFPRQTLDNHYRGLFSWLGKRLGRDCWIERSGSSIHYFSGLRGCFPKARFVHLHREGEEVALSMREHHAYRLPISLIYDAPLADGTRVSELGPVDFHAPPTATDPISRILESRPPPEYFGRYWADQVSAGIAGMQGLGPDQLLTVSFEELVRQPRATVARIAEFFELPAGPANWLDEAEGLVTGIPPARIGSVSESQQAALREVCRPAKRLLETG